MSDNMSEFYSLIHQYKSEHGVYGARKKARKEMIENILCDLRIQNPASEAEHKINAIVDLLIIMNYEMQ
jgi:hypothetical protein